MKLFVIMWRYRPPDAGAGLVGALTDEKVAVGVVAALREHSDRQFALVECEADALQTNLDEDWGR